MKNVFITGIAGFIGYHLYNHLNEKFNVSGIDSISNVASQMRAQKIPNILKQDINDSFLDEVQNTPNILIHLAAETGITGSLYNPELYFKQNIEGTFNVLEQCRKNGIKYLIYASSSSVYEPNQSVMFEDSPHLNQLSFYGSTKNIIELMIENYCRQFGLVAIGLRFFTVYGSWTRPDMAAYIFMKSINDFKEISLYNYGNVYRDFTHVNDVVETISRLIDKIQLENPGFHQIFNVGNGKPISVRKYAELIAHFIGKELLFKSLTLPSNELISTHANTEKLNNYIEFKPNTLIEDGVFEMVEWFKTINYE